MTRLLPLLLLSVCLPAAAQWLGVLPPTLPLGPDGSPDLAAATPRTGAGRPDLSGLWRIVSESGDLRDTSKLQAWAIETMAAHERNFYRDGPQMQCKPGGPGYIVGGPGGGGTLRQFVQSSDLLAMLFPDLTFRQVFTDGRVLEADPLPSWNGYSVGHWDGDTLVVESNGFNAKTWLHANGLEHTEQLRVTERFRRLDFGHLQVDITYDDPGTFTAPLHTQVSMEYVTDDAILEIVCDESTEGGTKHWTGDKLADARRSAVSVDPAVLADYVGSYAGIWLSNPTTVEVTLENGVLLLSRNGAAKAELIPQSDASFICATCTWSQPYLFNRDASGTVTGVTEVQVSGRWLFERVKR